MSFLLDWICFGSWTAITEQEIANEKALGFTSTGDDTYASEWTRFSLSLSLSLSVCVCVCVCGGGGASNRDRSTIVGNGLPVCPSGNRKYLI